MFRDLTGGLLTTIALLVTWTLGLFQALKFARLIGVTKEEPERVGQKPQVLPSIAKDSANHSKKARVKSLWIYPVKSCAGVGCPTCYTAIDWA